MFGFYRSLTFLGKCKGRPLSERKSMPTKPNSQLWWHYDVIYLWLYKCTRRHAHENIAKISCFKIAFKSCILIQDLHWILYMFIRQTNLRLNWAAFSKSLYISKLYIFSSLIRASLFGLLTLYPVNSLLLEIYACIRWCLQRGKLSPMRFRIFLGENSHRLYWTLKHQSVVWYGQYIPKKLVEVVKLSEMFLACLAKKSNFGDAGDGHIRFRPLENSACFFSGGTWELQFFTNPPKLQFNHINLSLKVTTELGFVTQLMGHKHNSTENIYVEVLVAATSFVYLGWSHKPVIHSDGSCKAINPDSPCVLCESGCPAHPVRC